MSSAIAHKIIWITGASSGIGKAVAQRCAHLGASVIVSGRDLHALNTLQQHSPNIKLVLPFDVTDKHAYALAVAKITASLGGVDIVFFNAGASEHMAEFSSDICERMMRVNYFSLVYGIEAVLPLLKQSRCPQLVGMSSIAAYGGLPQGEAYCAAKAAAKTLLEGLRVDLWDTGIRVSIVCPGFVKTPLTAKHKFALPGAISAEQAAHYIVKGISKRSHEIHFPKPISLLQKLITSLPHPIFIFIMRLALKRIKRQEAATANHISRP